MRHSMPQQGAQEGTEQPARMRNAIPCQPQARAQRRREAGAYIVFAIGGDRNIHRHDQCLKSRPRHAAHQRLNARDVAGHICLEPGSGRLLRHFFQRYQGRTAHDARNVLVQRRPRQHGVAAIRRQCCDPHRGNPERRGILVPEQIDSLIASRHIDQHPGGETVIVERLPVVFKRAIVFGGPRHVTEDRPRQQALRPHLEIGQGQHAAQGAWQRRLRNTTGSGNGGRPGKGLAAGRHDESRVRWRWRQCTESVYF